MKASYELESKENVLEEIEKHRKKAQEIEAAQACYTAQTEKLIKKLNSSIPGMLNDFSNLLKEIRQFNLDYCNITINIDECEQKEYGLQKSDDTIRFCFLESVGRKEITYSDYNDYFIHESKDGEPELFLSPDQAIGNPINMYIFINWAELIKTIKNEVISCVKDRDEVSLQKARKNVDLTSFYLEKLS